MSVHCSPPPGEAIGDFLKDIGAMFSGVGRIFSRGGGVVLNATF